jgi:glycosyltransferase involved in cell wall biosynthesis
MRPPLTPDLPDSGQRQVSVVIPARNEATSIASVIRAVQASAPSGLGLEIIVVDDGSSDETAAVAQGAGARTLELGPSADGGNPARARNRGAAVANGDPVVFLDADCTPSAGWLPALLAAHEAGKQVVGGSLDLPPNLPASARCDYYCGWYHVHSARPSGKVPNHPPGNLSVRRQLFADSVGFTEQHPIAYAHEELAWQSEVQRRGIEIYFQPTAVVYHRNRPGLGNLLRRNYRWGYSAIESKALTSAARMGWLYRHPGWLIAGSLPLAFVSTGYILACWLRVQAVEPALMWPAVLAARLAYSAGLVAGGIRWIRYGGATPTMRPRWE